MKRKEDVQNLAIGATKPKKSVAWHNLITEDMKCRVTDHHYQTTRVQDTALRCMAVTTKCVQMIDSKEVAVKISEVAKRVWTVDKAPRTTTRVESMISMDLEFGEIEVRKNEIGCRGTLSGTLGWITKILSGKAVGEKQKSSILGSRVAKGLR